ncbi:hypothetical protein C8R45DRAFT_1070436 [Mycena sanguinolenta]|nr:hypothetical protein C8R45DRAFT_1070436 [Mycena sanguinolenta]
MATVRIGLAGAFLNDNQRPAALAAAEGFWRLGWWTLDYDPSRARKRGERALNSALNSMDICSQPLILLSWAPQFCFIFRAGLLCLDFERHGPTERGHATPSSTELNRRQSSMPRVLQCTSAKARPQHLVYQLQYFRLQLAAALPSTPITRVVQCQCHCQSFASSSRQEPTQNELPGPAVEQHSSASGSPRLARPLALPRRSDSDLAQQVDSSRSPASQQLRAVLLRHLLSSSTFVSPPAAHTLPQRAPIPAPLAVGRVPPLLRVFHVRPSVEQTSRPASSAVCARASASWASSLRVNSLAAPKQHCARAKRRRLRVGAGVDVGEGWSRDGTGRTEQELRRRELWCPVRRRTGWRRRGCGCGRRRIIQRDTGTHYPDAGVYGRTVAEWRFDSNSALGWSRCVGEREENKEEGRMRTGEGGAGDDATRACTTLGNRAWGQRMRRPSAI